MVRTEMPGLNGILLKHHALLFRHHDDACASNTFSKEAVFG
jgi:hypothetical protein